MPARAGEGASSVLPGRRQRHRRSPYGPLALLLLCLLLALPLAAQNTGGLSEETRKQRAAETWQRLQRMSPQQRQAFLSKLPPDRRQRLQTRLDRWNGLPVDKQQLLREEYQLFQQLSADQQDAVRRQFRRYSALPENRRLALREELRVLRGLPDKERRERLRSPEEAAKFSEPERRLLQRLGRLMTPSSSR